jgi:hypothetical protein
MTDQAMGPLRRLMAHIQGPGIDQSVMTITSPAPDLCDQSTNTSRTRRAGRIVKGPKP